MADCSDITSNDEVQGNNVDSTDGTGTTADADPIVPQEQVITVKSNPIIMIKDFAYVEDEELYYGVHDYDDFSGDEQRYDDDVYEGCLKDGSVIDGYLKDGPPWRDDADYLGAQGTADEEYADEIHGKAIALFDFVPENENEVALKEGQIIWISYRHGQGWLVAEDSTTGETGLVPEEYVQLINDDILRDDNANNEIYDEDEPRRVLPSILTSPSKYEDNESDWLEEDDDKEREESDEHKLLELSKLDIKDLPAEEAKS